MNRRIYPRLEYEDDITTLFDEGWSVSKIAKIFDMRVRDVKKIIFNMESLESAIC